MQESLGFRLVQEQTQKLVMNQEMRQAITILQYSSNELLSYIEKQVESNPLFDLDHTSRRKKSGFTGKVTDNLIEKLSRDQQTLERYLLEQLSFHKLTAKQLKIGRYIIGNIDQDGYLREDLDLIATELQCTLMEIEQMLTMIQSFEPIGVGARTLAECILLQLRAKGEATPLIETVLLNHLSELAERKFALLARHYAVRESDLQSILKLVERVNPRPGMFFAQGEIKYIEPDLFVEYVDGQLRLALNERIYPQLSINEDYRQFAKRDQDRDSKSYIQERLRHAQWLIRSIEQRKATILKVAESILNHQKEFLVAGFDSLRPLTLQEIAADVGVHESTVSRATSQKYIQTDQGLIELKHFFVHGIATATGELTTPYPIKRKILALIQAEDKTTPLSDQQITSVLNDEGIQISRRTVMKYREELHIPASSKRRSRI